MAGVVQCYRGLELVASDDQLIFSAGDGLDLQVGGDYGKEGRKEVRRPTFNSIVVFVLQRW